MIYEYNNTKYEISVERKAFDDGVYFEARVGEFPYLFGYSHCQEEAYSLLVDGIETTSDIIAQKVT
jgi:hypothetical protein